MDKKTYQSFLSWLEESRKCSCDKEEIEETVDEIAEEEQLDEYESKSGRFVHKGTYGTSYNSDDDNDDDEPKKKPAPTGEKRGRGRPKGSTSGARQQGSGKSKSYGGIAFHSLNLPNSNK